jgi:hypothetical protein
MRTRLFDPVGHGIDECGYMGRAVAEEMRRGYAKEMVY